VAVFLFLSAHCAVIFAIAEFSCSKVMLMRSDGYSVKIFALLSARSDGRNTWFRDEVSALTPAPKVVFWYVYLCETHSDEI